MDSDTHGLTPHRLDPGHIEAADRMLYQWLNGRTAKGVGVVSCVHHGRDYAATVTDFLSVSYDPPTMPTGGSWVRCRPSCEVRSLRTYVTRCRRSRACRRRDG